LFNSSNAQLGMAISLWVEDVELGAVKVPSKCVMEADVGDDDQILEKSEKSVDAGFAKGVVAPVTVHGQGE